MTGGTLCYARDLIPAIADDIASVDRALRFGFNVPKDRSSCSMGNALSPKRKIHHRAIAGPGAASRSSDDALGPARVAERLQQEGRFLPQMLELPRSRRAQGLDRNAGHEDPGSMARSTT